MPAFINVVFVGSFAIRTMFLRNSTTLCLNKSIFSTKNNFLIVGFALKHTVFNFFLITELVPSPPLSLQNISNNFIIYSTTRNTSDNLKMFDSIFSK